MTVRISVNNGQAQLEVDGTGIGIAAEHLPHLGQRFYRIDKARSRETGGTGLGLLITHGISAIHGGALTLTSMPDQGTTVPSGFHSPRTPHLIVWIDQQGLQGRELTHQQEDHSG